MNITIIDTETTGLIESEGVDISLQPQIIEVYALQVTEDFEFVKDFLSFVKPTRPIPPLITKITGITNNDIIHAPIFKEVYLDIADTFLGSSVMVAHNLSFDLGMLVIELTRINKQFAFPYCPIHYCTVEQSMWIKGYRLKNSELLELATGKTEIEGAHRAKADVLATLESFKWLRNKAK